MNTVQRPDWHVALPARDREAAVSAAWGLLAVVALIWLLPIATRPLISPDEGRYAVLSLHMLQSGDWISPRLNGILYFEKPPLVYWAGAMAFYVFGVNEFAARLWPALSGIGCIAAMAWVAGAWWGPKAALRAIATTASMFWLVASSHFLTLDTSLTFGLSLALAGVLVAFAPGTGLRRRRVALWLAWFGMAVATLSKGPIGVVIPAAALVLYSGHALLSGDRAAMVRVWRDLEWVRGGLLFLALTLPWFVIVSWRNPGFAEFFFVHEHLLRYTTTTHRREGGIGYFVPMLLAGALPWVTLLLARAWRAAVAPRRVNADTERASPLRPDVLLWCWCGFVFVFFSLSGSKLPSYIVPMFPALGLLAALPARNGGDRLLPHIAVPLLMWCALPLVWVLLPWLPDLVRADTPSHALRDLLVHAAAGAVVFAIGAAIAWRLDARARATQAVVTVGIAHLLAALLLIQGYDRYAELRSAKSYAPLITAAVPADAPVFSIRMHDQTLPFYLQRNVTLVDYVDEFDFGERAEPGHIVPTLQEFVLRWRAAPAAAAVMAPDTFQRLADGGLPMRLLFRDTRRVVVMRIP